MSIKFQCALGRVLIPTFGRASSIPFSERTLSASRTTLRLPDRLKARAERAAAEEGVSVNTWFVRAIAAALEPTARPATTRRTTSGERFTGWAR